MAVEEGEVVVLVGPNGAGKTSLLRACAGLLALSSGEAMVLGCDLRLDRSSVRRKVGLLGHAAAVYEDLTVAENVRFALRAAGAPASHAGPALERLGLTGRLARTTVGRLSEGQRRRVALAALAARRPALWLLDEPHAGLDARARSVLAEMLAEAVAENATVVMASHEQAASFTLADRIVQMVGGRVVGETRAGIDAQSAEASERATPLAPVPGHVPDRMPAKRGAHVA